MFKNFVDASGRKDEISARRRIAPPKFCSAAPRDYSELRFVGETKRVSELLFVCWFKDQLRLNARDGIGRRRGPEMLVPENIYELLTEYGIDGGLRGLRRSVHISRGGVEREGRPIQKVVATETREH